MRLRDRLVRYSRLRLAPFPMPVNACWRAQMPTEYQYVRKTRLGIAEHLSLRRDGAQIGACGSILRNVGDVEFANKTNGFALLGGGPAPPGQAGLVVGDLSVAAPKARLQPTPPKVSGAEFSRQQLSASAKKKAGVGRTGQRPYMESICCRLQQTTCLKSGAHTAQSCQLIEPGGLIVGSIEIHTVPMAAHASNGVWTPVGLRGLPSWLGGGR
jgi:hypothetical protein